MSERREITIKEVEGGYIIDRDWAWRDRGKGAVEPQDRRSITANLETALELAEMFLKEPISQSLVNSK